MCPLQWDMGDLGVARDQAQPPHPVILCFELYICSRCSTCLSRTRQLLHDFALYHLFILSPWPFPLLKSLKSMTVLAPL